MKKVLTVANQKGGVGKTAISVHVAFDFVENKKLKVAFVDLDTQGNASYSLEKYDSGYKTSNIFDDDDEGKSIREHFSSIPDGPGLHLIASDAMLANMEKRSANEVGKIFRKNINALLEFVDVVLIDTPPSLGVSLAVALFVSDFVLSPIEMEVYSIQGIKKMITTIGNIRKVNPKLQFLGMMPSRFDGRNVRHKRHLEQLNSAYPKLMIPVTIGLRSSIADALASRVPVWTIKKTAARKAAKEVKAVADFVYQQLNTEKKSA